MRGLVRSSLHFLEQLHREAKLLKLLSITTHSVPLPTHQHGRRHLGGHLLRGLFSVDRSHLGNSAWPDNPLGDRPHGIPLLHQSLPLQDDPVGDKRRD